MADKAQIKALLAQAKTQLKEEKYTDALETVKEILNLDGKQRQAVVLGGICALRLGKFKQAEGAFLKAAKAKADDWTAHKGLCDLYGETNEWAKLASSAATLTSILEHIDGAEEKVNNARVQQIRALAASAQYDKVAHELPHASPELCDAAIEGMHLSVAAAVDKWWHSERITRRDARVERQRKEAEAAVSSAGRRRRKQLEKEDAEQEVDTGPPEFAPEDDPTPEERAVFLGEEFSRAHVLQAYRYAITGP